MAPWLEAPGRDRLEGEGVGGSPTNVALTFAGLGGRVRVVGPVARDPWGGRVRAALAAAGLALLELTPPPARQPHSLAFREPGGERRFLATFPELSPDTDLPAVDWSGPGWIVASSYEFRSPVFGALVSRAFAEARASGRRLAFDLADRHAISTHRPEIRALLAGGIDLLLGGSDALAALLGGEGAELPAEPLRRLGPLVLETRGADGVRLVTPDWDRWKPALPGPVVDTTGAGDALLGGVLAALSCGAAPEAALMCGIEVAAECLRHPGAGVPRARLEALRAGLSAVGGSTPG